MSLMVALHATSWFKRPLLELRVRVHWSFGKPSEAALTVPTPCGYGTTTSGSSQMRPTGAEQQGSRHCEVGRWSSVLRF